MCLSEGPVCNNRDKCWLSCLRDILNTCPSGMESPYPMQKLYLTQNTTYVSSQCKAT